MPFYTLRIVIHSSTSFFFPHRCNGASAKSIVEVCVILLYYRFLYLFVLKAELYKLLHVFAVRKQKTLFAICLLLI